MPPEEDPHVNPALFNEVKAALGGPPPELLLSARSESGYKGVHRAPGPAGLWQAQVTYKQRSRYLGIFSDVEEAALAYALALRGFKDAEERGQLRPLTAQPRPPIKFSKDRPVDPLVRSRLPSWLRVDPTWTLLSWSLPLCPSSTTSTTRMAAAAMASSGT